MKNTKTYLVMDFKRNSSSSHYRIIKFFSRHQEDKSVKREQTAQEIININFKYIVK